MKKLLAFLLLLSMFAFTGCDNDGEIILVNSNEVKGASVSRDWPHDELPYELTEDEIPLFIEKLNALQLQSKKNYRVNEEDIWDGGGVTIKIRLIDDTVLTFDQLNTYAVKGFDVGEDAKRKKDYIRFENVGIVTSDYEIFLDFWEYAESVSGYFHISDYAKSNQFDLYE